MLYLWGYLLSIVLANVLVVTVGVIPVGFGLVAPAGVLAAGLSLSLRDGVQERWGREWTVIAIAVGALLSASLSASLAWASFVAFIVSELADFAVYTPLRERGRLRALVASNCVGLVVDSALFLWLAFGSWAFLPGQVVGKLWMTLLSVVVLALWRRPRWLTKS